VSRSSQFRTVIFLMPCSRATSPTLRPPPGPSQEPRPSRSADIFFSFQHRTKIDVQVSKLGGNIIAACRVMTAAIHRGWVLVRLSCRLEESRTFYRCHAVDRIEVTTVLIREIFCNSSVAPLYIGI